MSEINSSCVMSGRGLLLITVRLSVSSEHLRSMSAVSLNSRDGRQGYVPAWSTQALGTPASGQTLQYRVLTRSFSSSEIILRPSSFPPRGAMSTASTAGNWAMMDRQVLAEPPLSRETECARMTEFASGCVGKPRLFVTKRVPDATTRRGRWVVAPPESWVSRRRRAISRERGRKATP